MVALLSFLIYLVALRVCTVSSQNQSDEPFCGDVLSKSCGICDIWKKDGKCNTDYAETYCSGTCARCRKDDKRTVLDVNYKGCYRDGYQSDFETMIPIKREYLDVRSCTGECHLKGYPFAAIQDAKFCMCSRQYGRYGTAQDESECMAKCITGSKREKCGGPWKNAVYEIAPRELQSGGVRLNDVAEKLIRSSQKGKNPEEKPEPQAQFSGVLTNQLNRLRSRSYYKPY